MRGSAWRIKTIGQRVPTRWFYESWRNVAFLLEVAIVDGGDNTIKVVHQFYGMTRKEVETYRREHLSNCGYFRSAENDDRTIEELEEIEDSELPTPDDYEDEEEEDDEG